MDTSFLDEDLEMIEVLDHPALFTDGRIPVSYTHLTLPTIA